MKKKLVFFLYIGKDKDAKSVLAEDKIMALHFENLKRFSNVFDEAVFVLSLKKELINEKDIIVSWATAIMELGYLNVRFKIEENTQMRECKAFHEEVVNGADNEGKLIFFGHNKGTTNEYNESLIRLICSMYYFSLSFPEEIDLVLNGMEHVYYGFPLLNAQWSGEPKAWEVMPKYKYFYYGTFFWTNISLLKEIMENKKRKYPVLVSRYYAENFPANTIEFDMVGTHQNTYMLSGRNLHYDFDESFNEYCEYVSDGEEEKKKFNEYCADIKKTVGIE